LTIDIDIIHGVIGAIVFVAIMYGIAFSGLVD
jgi:hypothetical protein